MDESEFSGPGTLGGGWLGTYAYQGRLRGQPPVRFEATLTEAVGGSFTGTILDDDGFGEADVRGELSGQGIRFTKEYRHRLPAVSYEGTLAEDGRTMAGTWRIDRNAYGVWDARRAWSDSGRAAEEDAEKGAAGERDWDKPRVREVVRLG